MQSAPIQDPVADLMMKDLFFLERLEIRAQPYFVKLCFCFPTVLHVFGLFADDSDSGPKDIQNHVSFYQAPRVYGVLDLSEPNIQ